jgi:hypothetical protein
MSCGSLTAWRELWSTVRRALTMPAGWASWGARRSARHRTTGACGPRGSSPIRRVAPLDLSPATYTVIDPGALIYDAAAAGSVQIVDGSGDA